MVPCANFGDDRLKALEVVGVKFCYCHWSLSLLLCTKLLICDIFLYIIEYIDTLLQHFTDSLIWRHLILPDMFDIVISVLCNFSNVFFCQF